MLVLLLGLSACAASQPEQKRDPCMPRCYGENDRCQTDATNSTQLDKCSKQLDACTKACYR